MKSGLVGLSISLVLGIFVGAWLFHDTRSRSVLTLPRCNDCLNPSQVLGLMASVTLRKAPGLIPRVVAETEHAIAMIHPFPNDAHHYVIIPKRDVRHVGDLSKEDLEAVRHCFELADHLVRERRLTHFRLTTNGPAIQHVNYLHFHLIAPG